MTKRLTVKYDFPYGPQTKNILGYRIERMTPYVIHFVYPHPLYGGKPFIIKGPSGRASKVIDKIEYPALVHITFWKNGRCRLRAYDILNVPGVTLSYIFMKNNVRKYGRPYVVISRKSDVEALIAKFRSVPRKWIKEINPFLNGGR